MQWLIAAGIWVVGLGVFAVEGFPKFYPLAMLGGILWAIGESRPRVIKERSTGNATAGGIMRVLGMSLGILVWGTVNCVAGWAVGRLPSGPLTSF